jgi:prevent-host-death family protein
MKRLAGQTLKTGHLRQPTAMATGHTIMTLLSQAPNARRNRSYFAEPEIQDFFVLVCVGGGGEVVLKARYAKRSQRCAARCERTKKRLYLVFHRGAKCMKYSTQIKPISYLKANAAEVVRQLADRREPLVITQNGEAKAVIQDVASYEETQETLALLKILALGNQQIEKSRVTPAGQVIKRLREKKGRG